MFSKTCEYAIRAVILIAQKTADGSRIGIKEVSAGIDSPEHFIAKILQELSRKGIIQSQKGPTGGFYLDAQSRKYTLADVVHVIDGDQIFTGCGLGLKQCSETKPCPLHYEFKKIRDAISKLLRTTHLGEFSEQLEQKLVFLKR